MSSHSIQMFGAVAECFQGPFPGENCNVQRVLLDADAADRVALAKTIKFLLFRRAERRFPPFLQLIDTPSSATFGTLFKGKHPCPRLGFLCIFSFGHRFACPIWQALEPCLVQRIGMEPWLSLAVAREQRSNRARSLGDARLKSGFFFQLRSTDWLLAQQLTDTLIIIAQCPRHRRGDEQGGRRSWVVYGIRTSCICGFAAL